MSTIKSSAENLTLNADGANNDIKFQSNGSEVASIDQAGTITATNFTGTGGNLTVKSDGTTPAIILRDSDNNIDGMFKALNGTVGMQVAGGDWALLATTNAEISLYHDNAVKLATTATGVAVTGGVAIGGTGAANTLDDYETGTWTAGLVGGDTAGNHAYHGRNGVYTKVGRAVHIQGGIHIDTIGNIAGNVFVTGLPFTVGTAGSAFNFSYAGSMNITAGTVPVGYSEPNATTFVLRAWDATSGTTMLSASEISDGAQIIFSGTYFT